MNDRSRRIFGFVIGLLMGLAYGLVAELINLVSLPGIPLYNAGSGPFAGVLLVAMGGGLIGLIAAWPEDILPGVILSSLAGALLTVLLSLPGMRGGLDAFTNTFVLLVITFLPRAFLFLPMAALVRWVLSVWATELQSVSFSVKKLALSVTVSVLVAGIAGLFSLYPGYGRQALAQANELVQRGMLATDSDSLPAALKPVDGFLQRAQGSYTLELSDNPDVLPVQRPIAPYGEQEYAVIIRFENGFRFGCAFTPTYGNPSCGNY